MLLEKQNLPPKWVNTKLAGIDWFGAVLKRHQDISRRLRTPEATSLRWATGFSRHDVSTFFLDKLKEVLTRDHFSPADIWNVEETGCTTVQRPDKTGASRGVTQVGAMVSPERGQLVTVCCAAGNTVPPVFIFPRVHYHDHFIRGDRPGSIGAAPKSGWMTSTNFLKFMQHFVISVRSSPDDKVFTAARQP